MQTQPCELIVDYNRTYRCRIELNAEGSGGLYRQNYEYYFFKLIARNELGNKSQEFLINNYDNSEFNIFDAMQREYKIQFSNSFPVRPDKVVDVNASNMTSDSVDLTWTIPSKLFTLERSKLIAFDDTDFDHFN